MSTQLTKSQKLKARQQLECDQLTREEERTSLRAKYPKIKGELSRIFKLWEQTEAYLTHCELQGTNIDNALYSTASTLRETAMARAIELLTAREAAAKAAAEKKASK